MAGPFWGDGAVQWDTEFWSDVAGRGASLELGEGGGSPDQGEADAKEEGFHVGRFELGIRLRSESVLFLE